jgi:hypothetical protein
MDIAIIEAGDATIRRIDRVPIWIGNGGAFEIRPGSHTFQIESTIVDDRMRLRARRGR